MLKENLIEIFSRELKKLKSEINSYPDENNIWKIEGKINNSAGNLCLHLIGNLSTYIGANLGETGFVRNRPAEFTEKNIPKDILIKMIDETIVMIEKVLTDISENSLAGLYPENVLGKEMTTSFFLIHLIGHLDYHLGQINYHRRLLD